jgi:putative ribosome biogenesis GTPase RsgA
MCFGPSRAEKRASAEQRAEAEEVKQEAIVKKAEQKREDISDAITQQTKSKYGRSGRGRSSLFQSTASGFLGRFE